MCLALPGVVVSRHDGLAGLPFGKVRFGRVAREICLAYTPDVQEGDYVIVHAGFAIQVLDEAAALRALALVEEDDAP